ncbi:BZ3500_MvSof-1268-A1-R1_Chr8-1g09999 [Microbotryum saponariae]|uniref:BZ3500_MvSof-1268-A1-R1_Chr8-1g09999 protein n=1 Tax=Microbotryum saponariae TaxID=289078 RepID=A0A2X0MU61_9BASI|nr:BZ3500_MvSof-1268-A1-R1_Chr8-1g09999 [Microbotryum saponariae]SDA08285.1 BZ3501_MvSof-1269-A2-R1_Chr8-1g09722 [Microbotryum saponariae]
MTTAQRPVLTGAEVDPLLPRGPNAASSSPAATGDVDVDAERMSSHTSPTPSAGPYLQQSLLKGWAAPLAQSQIGLLGSTIATWLLLYEHPAGLFSYHPALQSLAILFFAEGVLLLQPQPSNNSFKRKGLQLHQLFQYSGLVLILAGASVIIYNKAIHNAEHATTWHARFGFLTLGLILLQILFGAVVVYSPLAKMLLGGEGKAKRLWKYHRMSGYATMTLLIVTPLLALQSTWVQSNSSTFQRVLIGSELSVAGLCIVLRIQKSKLGL